MKKVLKIVSETSIIIAGIFIILGKFIDLGKLANPDFINILVIISLVTTLYYYRLELKDKNARIKELELKLPKNDQRSF